jgi:hypothetical protein
MIMRKGAPLLFALAALLGAAQTASASHCGFFRFSSCSDPCCDVQNCYSSCQQQNRVCYKVVYDTVEEKRWHTCYKTVCEMCTKQVTRCREECKTMYKECQVTKYRNEMVECSRQVQRCCWKDVQCTVMKPVTEHCTKNVECCVRRCVPKCCEKDVCYTVCCPRVEQHCQTQCCQIQKQICEQHCREVCEKVCRPVQVCCHREVCCQVSKCIEECHMKQVCVPCCKDVMKTCYKDVTRRICEPCTYYKTVTKRCIECVEEPCSPCREAMGGWFRGLFSHGCRDACPTDACPTTACKTDCCDPCFDPCACKTFHFGERLRGRLHGGADGCGDACGKESCGNACGPTCCKSSCAPCPTTRKVWRVKCTTEQVACTKMVTRCVTEKCAYNVCEKVRYNEIRNVPTTCRRCVRGAYVDDKGVAYECDGPGRTFKECAVVHKSIPYTVTKMVTSIEKHSVPYTVSRCVRGAYVDDKGVGYGCDGPGRVFKECANFTVTRTYCTTHMVQEQRVKRVQYTVNVMVEERVVKCVPYTVCRMVPCTVTKKVPYTVCEEQKYTVCRKVPYTECVMQPYTVRCMVPYTETITCPVTRQVKVCVPETVCVKKARLVPVTVSCEAPACPTACPDKGCCETGCCETGCCDRCGFLSRLRQRWFASLCSTGCCEHTCQAECTTTCNDCHDYCREGLLQRLFRNRFACEPSCCDSGYGTTTTSSPVMPPAAENINRPKALPK